MGDEWLRRLERKAAQGDPEASARLGREMGRSGHSVWRVRNQAEDSWDRGNVNAALNFCREVLSGAVLFSDDYLIIKDFLVSKGVNVLFFHRGQGENKREVFTLFDVPCLDINKNKEVLLDFCWDAKLFGGGVRVSQRDIVNEVNNLPVNIRDLRVVPSGPYFHWCVRFVNNLSKRTGLSDVLMNDIFHARQLFIDDLGIWTMTSTRVFYDKKKIEHCWQMPINLAPLKEEVGFDLSGNSDYLAQLGMGSQNIARVLIGANESISVLDNFYISLLRINGVFVRRLNKSGVRALILNCNSDNKAFNLIVSVIHLEVRVRLVAAKNFTKK